MRNCEQHPTFDHRERSPWANVCWQSCTALRGLDDLDAAELRKHTESGLLASLVEASLLVPTEMIEPLAGHAGAVSHPGMLPPLKPREYSPSMVKAAALKIIELWQFLESKGYGLRDANLAMTAVDGHGRIGVHSVASIVAQGSSVRPFDELFRELISPLQVMARHPQLADLCRRAGHVTFGDNLAITRPWLDRTLGAISAGPLQGLGRKIRHAILYSRFAPLFAARMYWTIAAAAIRRRTDNRWTLPLLNALLRDIRKLVTYRSAGKWTGYYTGYSLDEIMARDDWREHYTGERESAVLAALDRLERGSLLDIGANQGFFSIMAAKLGYQVTAIDYDVGAVDGLFSMLDRAGHKLPIRPAVVDFHDLTSDEWWRFRADTVLALGFTHHLRLVELLPWSRIAEVLSGLTGRTLITEFKPETGAAWPKGKLPATIQSDYRLENFTSALNRHFTKVEVQGTRSGEGVFKRMLVICRK